MKPGANSVYLPDLEFRWKTFKNVTTVVCIPAYKEESLVPVFQSLAQCEFIDGVGIELVFNCSELALDVDKNTNRKAFYELCEYLKTGEFPFPTHILLFEQLPMKKAGVGLARKLAMDAAWVDCKESKADILILCLDADCTVDSNYLKACNLYFSQNAKIQAASINFQHPIPSDPILAKGINEYELHLRYLKNALKWAKYPWYFHTVGSSMAVRGLAYKKAGGMNTRQAGEDFYFLHKLMPLGFGEIVSTTVYPKARLSDRVPFGTGKSMFDFVASQTLTTYNFSIFIELKKLFDSIEKLGEFQIECLQDLQDEVVKFWNEQGIISAWNEAIENSANREHALKRFYKWFSGFRIIRYLNTMAAFYPDCDVSTASIQMLNCMHIKPQADLLVVFQKLDGFN